MGQKPGTRLLTSSLQLGEKSLNLAVEMATARRTATIRITGYGVMYDSMLIQQLFETVAPAFANSDCTIIGGATRVKQRNSETIIPGVAEILPLIHKSSPNARVIGVVPRQTELHYYKGDIIVSDKPTEDYLTVIHAGLPACLLLQYSADRGFTDWNGEWQVSLDYMEVLREHGGHQTLHFVFGGGPTTKREVLHVLNLPRNSANPWRVMLVADSGGAAEELAADGELCRLHADRLVVCNAASVRDSLQTLGFLGPQEGKR